VDLLPVWCDYLPRPGDHNGERCRVCEEDGTCRQWAKTMAYDTGIPVRWLVDMILDGTIDHEWSVSKVKELYNGW